MHKAMVTHMLKLWIDAPEAGMHDTMCPFYAVRCETLSLRGADGILVPTDVGLRCVGHFRAVPTESMETPGEGAEDALSYGLMTAVFGMLPPCETDPAAILAPEGRSALLDAINRALEESDSPWRIDALCFSHVDMHTPEAQEAAESEAKDGGSASMIGGGMMMGGGAPRYRGMIMSRTYGLRRVAVYTPEGIPGERQCVCGKWSASSVCEACGTPFPPYGTENKPADDTEREKED